MVLQPRVGAPALAEQTASSPVSEAPIAWVVKQHSAWQLALQTTQSRAPASGSSHRAVQTQAPQLTLPRPPALPGRAEALAPDARWLQALGPAPQQASAHRPAGQA
jgi:hypothetical protein